MKRWFLLLALTLGACAHTERDQTICPEYRGRTCLSVRDCDLDRSRGCMVCQCRAIDQGSPPYRSAPGGEAHGASTPPPR